jgi:hypothetical protein
MAAKVGIDYFGALREKNRPIAKIHERGARLGARVPQEATATPADVSVKIAGADSRERLFNYV